MLEGLFQFWTVVITVFVLTLALNYWLFTAYPKGFVPDEDQGYFVVMVQLPEGASLERTAEVVDRVRALL